IGAPRALLRHGRFSARPESAATDGRTGLFRPPPEPAPLHAEQAVYPALTGAPDLDERPGPGRWPRGPVARRPRPHPSSVQRAWWKPVFPMPSGARGVTGRRPVILCPDSQRPWADGPLSATAQNRAPLGRSFKRAGVILADARTPAPTPLPAPH